MRFLEFSVLILGVIALSLALTLISGTLTDYRPPDVEDLKILGSASNETPSELTLLTWNIGYAGLGKDEDFFFSGGKKTRPSKSASRRYLDGIKDFLRGVKEDVDVVFLQEVDRESDRSYRVDQFEEISEIFEDFQKVFATNYKVNFVPVPFNDPLGKVFSGLAVFSRYSIKSARRYSLPGQYPWPEGIYQLDRCMIVVRIPAPNGKEWVLINTHNSAYDEGGFLRKLQLSFIKDFIMLEYALGNYVVVGGDWNAILAEGDFDYTQEKPDIYIELPEGWTPSGWKWGVDPRVPTNRFDDRPYKKGENYVTVIDGFLVSPNVDIESVQGIDLGFEDSDHNPVVLKVRVHR